MGCRPEGHPPAQSPNFYAAGCRPLNPQKRAEPAPYGLDEPFLPFFVSRDPGVPDPGIGGDAGGITWIEVAGVAARLEQWLDFSPLPVRVVDGAPAVLAVGIGAREFR
jgi:hypothetical protein